MPLPSRTWRIESDPSKEKLAGAVALAIGIVMLLAGGGFGAHAGDTTRTAASALGALLALVGAVVWLLDRRQAVTVDMSRRCIVIEQSHRFGASAREVAFADVVDVSVDELGDQEGGSTRYHVSLKLRSGRDVALFLGAFEGVYSRPAMQAHRDAIAQSLALAAKPVFGTGPGPDGQP